MEKLKGVEALRQYSFRDVAMPRDRAFRLINARSRSVISANAERLIRLNVPRASEPGVLENLSILDKIKKNPKLYSEAGGLSMSRTQLESFYTELGHLSFQKVMENTLNNVPLPPDRVEDARYFGVEYVGYILDFMRITKPEVAGPKDVIGTFIDSMRNNRINITPIELGFMVDQTAKRIGSQGFDTDLQADRDAAGAFRFGYMLLASDEEVETFLRGERLTW